MSRCALESSYTRVVSELLNPLIEYLTYGRDLCGGDLDKLLILLVIGSRTSQHAEFKALTVERMLSGEMDVLPSLATNARSIAARLKAPRESVRRKIDELLQAGWIARQGRNLRITAAGVRHLEGLREAFARMVLRHHEVVASLARGDRANDAPQPAAPRAARVP